LRTVLKLLFLSERGTSNDRFPPIPAIAEPSCHNTRFNNVDRIATVTPAELCTRGGTDIIAADFRGMTNPNDDRPQNWSTPTIQIIPLTEEQLVRIRKSDDPETALRDAYLAHQCADACGRASELADGADETAIATAVRAGLDRCRKLLNEYRVAHTSSTAKGDHSRTA
jgi:hypothetical protein